MDFAWFLRNTFWATSLLSSHSHLCAQGGNLAFNQEDAELQEGTQCVYVSVCVCGGGIWWDCTERDRERDWVGNIPTLDCDRERCKIWWFVNIIMDGK